MDCFRELYFVLYHRYINSHFPFAIQLRAVEKAAWKALCLPAVHSLEATRPSVSDLFREKCIDTNAVHTCSAVGRVRVRKQEQERTQCEQHESACAYVTQETAVSVSPFPRFPSLHRIRTALLRDALVPLPRSGAEAPAQQPVEQPDFVLLLFSLVCMCAAPVVGRRRGRGRVGPRGGRRGERPGGGGRA